MVYKRRKTVHVLLIVLFLITAGLTAANFIKTHLKMSTYSLILPKEKWLITIGGGGQVISNLINFSNGQTVQYNITQFERGESIAMNFANSISGKKEFAKGDTVISMVSSFIKDQLVSAMGDLQMATAKYESLNSAEKLPLIKEAETKLIYIDEKIGEQKILSERTKQLFDKGYASQQEFELQKWNLDLLKIEKEIYTAQLENLKTGVKPKELDYLKTEINSVKARMNFLKERESQLIVVSPINGRVVNSLSPDTLLNVVNSKQIVLQVPVKLSDYSEFRIGQKISVDIDKMDLHLIGEIVSIDSEVKILNQQQVVLIFILAENPSEKLLSGMVTETTLQLRELSLLQQLIRFIFS